MVFRKNKQGKKLAVRWLQLTSVTGAKEKGRKCIFMYYRYCSSETNDSSKHKLPAKI